jgi:uncharacterized protein YbbK (DUF523 family)
MQYVLVSACLLGEAVRYDGGDKRCTHPVLQRWQAEGRIVALCPEVAGGLPIPRAATEITGGAGGQAVLAGRAQVVDRQGQDVSTQFVSGATCALALVHARGIQLAVLKEGSPSCGSSYSYDGSFNGTQVSQPGVTTALLRAAGLRVFSERQLADAEAWLRALGD